MSAAPPDAPNRICANPLAKRRAGRGYPTYGDFYREAVRIPLRFTPTKNQKAGDLQTKSSALFGRKINEKVLLTVPSITAGY